MLNVGLFGVGHLGRIHLKNWLEIKDVRLCGFYDPDQKTAQEIVTQYNIPYFSDPQELLHVADAVDIVAPTNYHYDLCELAIKAGKHIFVEKPMCDSMEQAQSLIKLVKEANIKFQVGHVERFNPAFLSVHNVPIDPMFIEVHRLAQFNPRGTEVSVILDLMIHDIDIVLKLVNSEVKQVHASGVAVMTSTPDIANVRIEFNNGCVANLTSSRISMKKMRKIRIFQRDAYIGIDFLEKKSEIIRMNVSDQNAALNFDIETREGKKSIAVIHPEVQEANAIRLELEYFRDAILLNRPVPVSELDGFRAMDVAHQILQQIQKASKY
ncbi:MAG: Gfo/Idh/MocA family protein [Bacteroidota bacterium]